jgi:hypothetical protein
MTGVPPKLSTITAPERPGLPLHYQWRDYAPLQSRPSLPHAITAWLEAASTGQETGSHDSFNDLLSQQNSKVIEVPGQIDNSDKNAIEHRSTR